jgi:hypothetical protein
LPRGGRQTRGARLRHARRGRGGGCGCGRCRLRRAKRGRRGGCGCSRLRLRHARRGRHGGCGCQRCRLRHARRGRRGGCGVGRCRLRRARRGRRGGCGCGRCRLRRARRGRRGRCGRGGKLLRGPCGWHRAGGLLLADQHRRQPSDRGPHQHHRHDERCAPPCAALPCRCAGERWCVDGRRAADLALCLCFFQCFENIRHRYFPTACKRGSFCAPGCDRRMKVFGPATPSAFNPWAAWNVRK